MITVQPSIGTPEPLQAKDFREVARLFRRTTQQHAHIDWRSLEEWLPDPAFHGWVVRSSGRIGAVMAATTQLPPSRSGVAWLRFMLPGALAGQERTLDALWEALREHLIAIEIKQVALIVINTWVTNVIARWGFRERNAVVTMQRRSGEIPAAPEPPLVLREVRSAGELAEIAWLDARAFGPLWQYDRDTLAAARREAATFTRLERDGQLLGYELSTRHVGSAHLARLAVLPGEQGQGLGGLLVGHMLRFFEARGIHLITVNTQEDNIRSQRLYKRLGFEFTGHRAPVWEAEL